MGYASNKEEEKEDTNEKPYTEEDMKNAESLF